MRRNEASDRRQARDEATKAHAELTIHRDGRTQAFRRRPYQGLEAAEGSRGARLERCQPVTLKKMKRISFKKKSVAESCEALRETR